MGRSALGLIAIVAVAAFGIGLIVPDSASARAGGASRGGSRATTFGSGFRGHPGGAFRHGAVPRGSFARGRGGIRRHGGIAADPSAGLDGGWPSGALGDVGSSGCQVQRVQISDDYGWRVRDVMV